MGVERHRSKLRHFPFDLQYEPGYTSPCDNASIKPPPKTHFSKEEKEELGVDDEEEDKEIRVNRVEEEAEVEATVAHGGGEPGEEEQGHQELGIWAGVPGCTASVLGMRPAPMQNRDTPEGH